MSKPILLQALQGLVVGLLFALIAAPSSRGQDLDEIKAAGVLRHLSIPYAHFNSGAGDGLDIDLVRLFAAHLGVRYKYVPTVWADAFGDLIGQKVKAAGDEVDKLGATPIKGDVLANGVTVLPWREKVVAFSKPTFPTQVWLVAPIESPLPPITPTGDLQTDIAATRRLVKGSHVMGKSGTCLDLSIFHLETEGASGVDFEGSLNELAPALLKGETDLLLLDVPDALVALNTWPGKIKVLGPMTGMEDMAAAFRPGASQLLAAFNAFFEQCLQDGTYLKLVRQYYPDVLTHFPKFFPNIP